MFIIQAFYIRVIPFKWVTLSNLINEEQVLKIRLNMNMKRNFATFYVKHATETLKVTVLFFF